MQQRYHSNATTNVRLRSQINGSEKSIKALSDQYGVSRKTVPSGRNAPNSKTRVLVLKP